IFLSYKRNVAPDEPVALELCQALEAQQHRVFMDLKMTVGTRWVERIEQEIFQADVLIVLLSEAATCSEMVQREIELARQSQAKRQGLPMILPVRLAYEAPFSYPLSEYLNPLNWAIWSSPADTPRLSQELISAIAGQDLPIAPQEAEQRFTETLAQDGWAIPTPSAPPPKRWATLPVPLEPPTQGTMRVDSKFYIERPEDARALDAIQQPGITITIKGARQMGKSSLLSRVTDAAQKAGKQVAFIDFQFVEQEILRDANAFFQQFCLLVTDELDLEDEVLAYWDRPKEGNLQRCTRYMRKHILGQLDGPLMLAMDEVERIFVADFRTDFFSMLRGWHNKRAMNPLWQRLDLALITSTEPYLFINDQSQSPFNVGEVLDLRDFSVAQVADLNQRHGKPLSAQQVERLTTLVHGHPYLVRRALYLVACQQMTSDMLFNESTRDRGPFGDHLRHHLSLLRKTPDLTTALSQVIRNQYRLDDNDFFRLRGAGLVRKEVVKGKEVIVPRCPLYADYFREHLRG
ncbi:MAG: TIR domain-containing protein, partial [Leptolyngbya sp. DLM2.Bin15]